MRPYVVLILALSACATSLPTPTLWTTPDPVGADALYRRHAPCSAAERDVDGLCWVATDLRPPCMDTDVVRDGMCLAPTYSKPSRSPREYQPWAHNLSLGPLPRDEQKQPPCMPEAEVEHDGVCWMPHMERPPCPDLLVEHDGICLAPLLPEE